jgi:hypothetical protein
MLVSGEPDAEVVVSPGRRQVRVHFSPCYPSLLRTGNRAWAVRGQTPDVLQASRASHMHLQSADHLHEEDFGDDLSDSD